MLAVSDEAVAIVFMALVFFFVSSWAQHRHKERTRRLELLDKALADPRHDDATRRELMRQLAPESSEYTREWKRWFSQNLRPHRIAAAGGWSLFLIGLAVMAVGGHYDFKPGFVMSAIGFGILTMPMAVREYERRRAA